MNHGILGGTFDPVHRGHLDLATAAHAGFGLDRVTLLPSRMPPHRRTPHASAAHRFAMIALAIQAYSFLHVSDFELQDDGPSFTVTTLDRLGRRGVDLTGVVFVTGADAFAGIREWKSFPALLDRCHFGVVSRPGHRALDLRALLPELADRMHVAPCPMPSRPSILLLDSPTAPVSATDVRRRAATGGALDDLVAPAVAAHIQKHRLYMTVDPEDFA